MMNDDREITKVSDAEAIGNLHMCNCPDDGAHTTVEVHQLYCDYRSWYLARLQAIREEQAKQ